MSLAFTWVKYNSTPVTVDGKTVFVVENTSLPFLHLGTYAPDATYAGNRKFLLGLKFRGSGATNIKVWMDGTKCDFFPLDGDIVDGGDLDADAFPILRKDWQAAVGSSGLGIEFRYVLLSSISVPIHTPTKAATTVNIPNISSSLIVSNVQDGVTLSVNDRLLVKNQTLPKENGIYSVTNTYTDQSLVLVRASDLDVSGEIKLNGFITDNNTSTPYYLYTPASSPILGTSAINWIDRSTITSLAAAYTQTTNISDLSNGPMYVDGALVTVGDRILLKGQTDPTQNGVYQVASINNAGTYSLTRTSGYHTADNFTPYTIQYVQSDSTTWQWHFDNWDPSTFSGFFGTVSLSNSSYNSPTFTQITGAIQSWDFCTYCVNSMEDSFASMAWAANDGHGNNEVFTGCPNMLMHYQPPRGMTTLVPGDKILVIGSWPGANGTGHFYNGIYTVVTVGTGTNGVWKRTTNWNTFGSGGATNHYWVTAEVSEGQKGWLAYLAPGALTMDTSLQKFYPYINGLDYSGYHLFGPSCATRSTSNLSNLASVGSTINGHSLQLGDNVLVMAQTTGTENGSYTVTTAPTTVLTRVSDFTTGARTDRVSVTLSGGSYASEVFDLYSPASYTVGTTPIYWYQRSINPSYTACDYASVDNVDLTTNALSSDFGGATLTVGLRMLLNDQTNPAENGIYVIQGRPSISLARASDFNNTSDIVSNYRISVTNGLAYSNTYFGLWWSGSPTLDTTDLYFVKQPLVLQLNDCKVATTANLTATYSTGTLTNSGTQVVLTIDDQVLTVGDRVLVKDQSTAPQNGIYIVTNTGSVSTNWVLTRSSDMSTSNQIFPQATLVVDTGTVNAQSIFEITIADVPNAEPNYYTIGTTNFTWTLQSPTGFFFEAPSSSDWTDFPTTSGTAFSLGDAVLNSKMEADSALFGFAAKVPIGAPTGQVRNFRMIVTFDTLDS